MPERKPGGKTVTVLNNTRRPLQFAHPGGSCRLSPGGTMSVPESWLKTTELRRLCDSTLVTVAEMLPGEGARKIASEEEKRVRSEAEGASKGKTADDIATDAAKPESELEIGAEVNSGPESLGEAETGGERGTDYESKTRSPVPRTSRPKQKPE